MDVASNRPLTSNKSKTLSTVATINPQTRSGTLPTTMRWYACSAKKVWEVFSRLHHSSIFFFFFNVPSLFLPKIVSASPRSLAMVKRLRETERTYPNLFHENYMVISTQTFGKRNSICALELALG